MSYKTILVQVDDTDAAKARIRIAADIALADGAHLIGAAFAGTGTNDAKRSAMDGVGAALDGFDGAARAMGVDSFEARRIDGEAATGLSLHGRYSDLIVIGQGAANDGMPASGPDFIEYVVINCARPVLLVPGAELRTGTANQVGGNVLVAWNGSVPAARAVRDAMPLLVRARQVHVAIINAAPDALGDEPGADIALYLARHGIEVDVIRQTVDTEAGRALLSLADRLSCNLLVMGCAAHHRTRGFMLGGATYTVLQSSHLPVLMSH